MSQLGGWGMNQPLTCSRYDIPSPCSTPPSPEAVMARSQRVSAMSFHTVTTSSRWVWTPVPALHLWTHHLSLSEPQCPHL